MADMKKMSTEQLKRMIKQAEGERVSPVFGQQVRAARQELRRRGVSMREEVEVVEAYKKGDWVKHKRTGRVGQIVNVTNSGVYDIEYNSPKGPGYKTTVSHTDRHIEPMKTKNESVEHTKNILKEAVNRRLGEIQESREEEEQVESRNPLKYMRVPSGEAGKAYAAKKAAERQAQADKNDPGAKSKNYGPGVVDREKAAKKARSKGIDKHADQVTMNYNRKLPEEVEQVDELKKSTMVNYISKAVNDAAIAAHSAGANSVHRLGTDNNKKDYKIASKRVKGVQRASRLLAKEDKAEYQEAYKVPSNYAAMMQKKKKDEKNKGLDDVKKKEALKSFKARKDKDIDNDGDVDSSDKYLHNRRQKITKSIEK